VLLLLCSKGVKISVIYRHIGDWNKEKSVSASVKICISVQNYYSLLEMLCNAFDFTENEVFNFAESKMLYGLTSWYARLDE